MARLPKTGIFDFESRQNALNNGRGPSPIERHRGRGILKRAGIKAVGFAQLIPGDDKLAPFTFFCALPFPGVQNEVIQTGQQKIAKTAFLTMNAFEEISAQHMLEESLGE